MSGLRAHVHALLANFVWEDFHARTYVIIAFSHRVLSHLQI